MSEDGSIHFLSPDDNPDGFHDCYICKYNKKCVCLLDSAIRLKFCGKKDCDAVGYIVDNPSPEGSFAGYRRYRKGV